jgi:ankyrin repeat protein
MRKEALFVLACLLGATCSSTKSQELPSFDYDVAHAHELKPHRRTIPLKGISQGFNQLHLTLTVAPTGDVVRAEMSGNDELIKFWPTIRPEVLQWKFTLFEENGKPVTAEIEEYIDLVPPERFPAQHVAPPLIRPNSKVAITLLRSGCFGSCPSYSVTISTNGIAFQGGSVVAFGKHTDTAKPHTVRALARKFVAADFYSMNSSYRASVTDNPTYVLSITIDGRKKEVADYVGQWVGMPAVIAELEDAVDTFARTERWINGSDGLVAALQSEHFNFKTYAAQVMLKQALTRGQLATVQEFLSAGVPLQPIPPPEPDEPDTAPIFQHVGWLNAASEHPETLQVLLEHGASRNDQNDKDLALVGAARSGKLEAVRALIVYGANPNADLSKSTVEHNSSAFTVGEQGAGSILIYAAESGNPDVVREILRYRSALEARDREGKTAMFAAGEYRNGDKDGARVECVRLLAAAGADVNARDDDGNTPLHETFLTDVEEELLKLGADVNARNNDGDTPIFTNVDEDSIPLFIAHGADLTIRNNKGQTLVEAAKQRGPAREEALRKALHEVKPP